MTDLVNLVETSYRLDLDMRGWLRELAHAARPLIPEARATMAFLADARDLDRVMTSVAYATDGHRDQWVLNPTPTMENFEVARRFFFGGGYANTASGFLRGDHYDHWHETVAGRMGLEDMLGLLPCDPDGYAISVAGQLEKKKRLSRGERRVWSLAAAHLGAGFRLRRRLAPDEDFTPLFEGAEAVLGSGGKVHHAEGTATSRTARDALREAAKRVDKARTRRTRARSDEALEMWRALVSGRWSLVDAFDSDGRRFWVAHANAPDAPDPRALDARERQVVTLAAMGHSQKLIAYELGLSVSTISRTLRSGLRKLRLDGRTALSQWFLELWQERATKTRETPPDRATREDG